jgi:hypothetical protein
MKNSLVVFALFATGPHNPRSQPDELECRHRIPEYVVVDELAKESFGQCRDKEQKEAPCHNHGSLWANLAK